MITRTLSIALVLLWPLFIAYMWRIETRDTPAPNRHAAFNLMLASMILGALIVTTIFGVFG